MLDGTLCGICGVYLGQDWRGIPTLCKSCAKHPDNKPLIQRGAYAVEGDEADQARKREMEKEAERRRLQAEEKNKSWSD